MAIMGPSGSGKTTLLNVLAGQLAASPRLHLSGLLEVNGQRPAKKAYKYEHFQKEIFECAIPAICSLIYYSSLFVEVLAIQVCIYKAGRPVFLTVDCS